MEKRYQVFVSSTYRDLQDERSEVIQALLELDCIPAGMELFPASDETQWELIKRVIDDCDYYIVIIGGRYGSIDADGVSYTEKEFDYAVEKGIPVLIFPIEDPGKIPANKTQISDEAQAKLTAFREKATANRPVKFWISPEDLAGKVSRSLVKETKQRPAEGWVRARYAGDADTLLKLHDRIKELEAAVEAATTQAPAGVEDLAQGADPFVIGYSLPGSPGSARFPTNWFTIIGVVGPLMFDECSEHRMKLAMNDWISRHVPDKRSDILENCFQTIKVQLIALGIIQKSERKRTPSDTQTYWSLTAWGANYVTKLRAVRKTSPPVEGFGLAKYGAIDSSTN